MNNNLRQFEENTPQYNFYKEQHKNQTLNFVKNQMKEYGDLDNNKHASLTIQEVLKLMDSFIDPSDPDIDVVNSIHNINIKVLKEYVNYIH